MTNGSLLFTSINFSRGCPVSQQVLPTYKRWEAKNCFLITVGDTSLNACIFNHAASNWRLFFSFFLLFFSFLLSLSGVYVLTGRAWPYIHLPHLPPPALELAVQICTSDLSHDLRSPGLLFLLTLLCVWLTITSESKRGGGAVEDPPTALRQHRGRVTGDIFRKESNGSDTGKAQRKTQLWNLTLGFIYTESRSIRETNWGDTAEDKSGRKVREDNKRMTKE